MMTRRLAVSGLLLYSAALCQPVEDRIQALAAKAREAQQSGATNAAIQAYEGILRLRPGWAQIEFNLGALYQVEKRYPESIRILTSALQHDASVTPAHLFLGMAYYSTGQYEKARVSLERFRQLSPADPEARFFLAQTYFALEDFAKAIREYKEQTQLSSDRPEVFYYLGESYLAQARRVMETLKAQPAGEYYRLLLAAEAQSQRGNGTGEEEILRKVIALDPKRSEGYASLGNLFLKKGAKAEAKAHFENALKRDPRDCGALRGLSDATRAPGNRQAQAAPIHCVEDASPSGAGPSRIDRNDPPALYRRFRAYTRLAEEAYAKLVALAPDSYLVAQIRAEALEEQQKYEEAGREYERAAKMSPRDAGPWLQFARFQCKLDRFDAAVPLLQKALAIDPHNTEAQGLLGEAYFLKNDWKAAVPQLEVAVKARPGATQTRIYLARSLQTLGRLKEAAAVLESAPADPDGRIHVVLAACYRAQGRPEAAARAQVIAEQRRATKQQ